ncbi:MAG: phenylacetate-CoA oxygenase subunit PaaI [Rhizobiaceae bacterium]|nr:phenylacetate-CoA oxygenase subunit PaaI [Rhizobiaceae bacterium]
MAVMEATQSSTANAQRQRQASIEKLERGELLEEVSELFPEYRAVLEQTLTIAAQSEVTVLTWAYTVYNTCPDIGAKIAVSASIQDEIGHAYQQGMLLDRLGLSMEELTFDIPPESIKTLMVMQFPLKNYIEFCMGQAIYDRAGRLTTKDIELHCSFAPYRRALRKVNFEENFHVRHGERWIKFYWNHSPETRKAVQEAADWCFPHGLTWFGLPDHLKTRKDQLNFGIRKWSNDEMREKWFQSACIFANQVGFDVPAHFDEEQGKYVLDCPYPMLCDKETMTWKYEQATWEETIAQLKSGGPLNPSGHARLQSEEWGDSLWAM